MYVTAAAHKQRHASAAATKQARNAHLPAHQTFAKRSAVQNEIESVYVLFFCVLLLLLLLLFTFHAANLCYNCNFLMGNEHACKFSPPLRLHTPFNANSLVLPTLLFKHVFGKCYRSRSINHLRRDCHLGVLNSPARICFAAASSSSSSFVFVLCRLELNIIIVNLIGWNLLGTSKNYSYTVLQLSNGILAL